MATPRNVLLAIQLMVFNLLLLVLINMLIFTTHEMTFIEPKTYLQYSNLKLLIETCIRIALIITFAWGMLRAYPWSRWLYIAYVVAHQLLHIITHSDTFSSYTVFYMAAIYITLEVISLLLLISPTANRWFQRPPSLKVAKGHNSQRHQNLPTHKVTKSYPSIAPFVVAHRVSISAAKQSQGARLIE